MIPRARNFEEYCRMACALCVLLVLSADAQERGRGVASIGLGTIETALSSDAWAVLHNPANLARVDHLTVSAFYGPGLFGLKELRTIAATACSPLMGAAFGASIEQFGFSLYKESTFSAGIGSLLGAGTYGGIALNFRETSISGYGQARSILVNAGTTVGVLQGLHFAFLARNILGETIGTIREPLPQQVLAGMGYEPIPDMLIAVEAEKDTRWGLCTKAGLSYRALDVITISTGFSRNPDRMTLGAIVEYTSMTFGYAAANHPSLGWTHQIEVTMMVGS